MTILASMTRRSAASLIANLALCSAAMGQTPTANAVTPELVARLDRLTFTGADPATLANYESEEIWRKAAIAGVSTTASGDILLTVPRWLDARVPASLVRLTAEGTVAPWPNAAAHDLANPAGLRSVLGLQRDARGRLWVLDMGWVAGEQGPMAPGAAKLVALDAATGAELQRIPLDSVAGPGSFLNDVAVDTARDVAFISDSGVRGGPENPTAIIVVDLRRGTARRVLERHVSTANNRAVALTASGEAVFPGNPLQVGVNGIALSPDGETLYWGLTTGNGIFSAPAALLRDPGTPPAALAAAVVGIAAPGGIDGMTVDARGRIYVAGITAGAVLRIDPRSGAIERLAAPAGTVWPDSLGWTPDGALLFTVNQLNRVFGGTASFAPGSGTFSVWRIPARQIAAASAT